MIKGILALISGVIGLVVGFLLVGATGLAGFVTAVVFILSLSCFLAIALGVQSWRKSKQFTGVIGAILGVLGLVEMLIAIL